LDAIIRKSKRERTAYMEIGAWYGKEGEIFLSVPGTKWFITTINNRTGSKRSHPHLYSRLDRALKEVGVKDGRARVAAKKKRK
jgi:hypothetical protein